MDHRGHVREYIHEIAGKGIAFLAERIDEPKRIAAFFPYPELTVRIGAPDIKRNRVPG
jgi:hypothetical protein